MDSPPQTVTVRGGDFLCGKSSRLFFLCYNEKSNHETAARGVHKGIIGENVKPVSSMNMKKMAWVIWISMCMRLVLQKLTHILLLTNGGWTWN